MCTILFLYRVHPLYPVVVAANRDEFYDRPAVGPQVLSKRPRSIGALDLQHRGTWIGANEKGLIVGLTNQRSHRPADRSLRTRGEIVRTLLSTDSVAAMIEQLQKVNPREYNPFNVLFGSARDLYLCYARHERADIAIERAPEGIHALANDNLGSPEFPRATRAEQLATPICRLPWPQLAPALGAILADHQIAPLELVPEPPPESVLNRAQLHQLQVICIHTETYGTRSSTIIALEPSRVAHYLFAPGAPCQTPFEDVTRLLDEPFSSLA
jgi:uncharacterized protein with NRDE domain